ncbi:MAG: hypothetical protein CM15mP10_1130 [Actinomycetota bacterium]|nr:MAG: hypothetical protein CM15mP10_1130 [Actinomycetota bacterium]
MDDYIIKRFENPDEIREFDKGKYEVVNLPHMTIGKATYHKGWKWSDDVSPLPVQSSVKQSIWGWSLVEMLRWHSKMKNQK